MNEILEEAIECYSGPILYIGKIDKQLKKYDPTTLSLVMEKSLFAIINKNVPIWIKLLKLKENLRKENNILLIKDLDKVSEEDQGKILDIIKTNKISSFSLPQKLIVILNAEKEFEMSEELQRLVEIIRG